MFIVLLFECISETELASEEIISSKKVKEVQQEAHQQYFNAVHKTQSRNLPPSGSFLQILSHMLPFSLPFTSLGDSYSFHIPHKCLKSQ